MSPSAHGLLPDPERNHREYMDALSRLKAQGVAVLDMESALKLGNDDFADRDHPNRWGAFAMADFLYRNVIRPWFPQQARAEALTAPTGIRFWDIAHRTNPDFYIQDRSRIPPTAVYSSPLQLVTERKGARIEIPAALPPGRYEAHLYGADERTTRTPGAPMHRLAFEIAKEGGAKRTVQFGMSRELAQGAALTMLGLDLETTSRLALVVMEPRGGEVVLDSLFLRRRLPPGDRAGAPQPAIPSQPAVPDPYLVGNGSFEFASRQTPGYPAEWAPYTGDRAPWGKVDIVDRGDNKGRAARTTFDPATKGWGCMIVQPLAKATIDRLRGHRIAVSVWAKSSGTRLMARVMPTAPETTETLLSAYTQPGTWQELGAQLDVPTSTTWMVVTLGTLSPDSALFDDFEIEVVK